MLAVSRFVRYLLALFAIWIANCGTGIAEAPSPEQVKAALVFNFARYVEWPQKEGNEIVFGVMGSEAFYRTFRDMVDGKSLGGRKVVIRRFDTPADIEPTHILFTGSDAKLAASAVERVRGRSVLTVGDSPAFLSSGGMINLVTRDDKVRFEINAAAAKRAGLSISSALLALSDRVIR